MSISEAINRAVNILLAFVTLATATSLVWMAYHIVSSGGRSSRDAAAQAIINSSAGLVVASAAYAVVDLLLWALGY